MIGHVTLPMVYPGREKTLAIFAELKVFNLWYTQNDEDARFIFRYGMCHESAVKYSDILQRYKRLYDNNGMRVVKYIYGECYLVWRETEHERHRSYRP